MGCYSGKDDDYVQSQARRTARAGSFVDGHYAPRLQPQGSDPEEQLIGEKYLRRWGILSGADLRHD